jgi:hypothetical protein
MKTLTVDAPEPGRFDAFWHWLIGRLRALRNNERYDRWVLSEREQAVKLRNRLNAERKARERSAARKAARRAEREREQAQQALADRK